MMRFSVRKNKITELFDRILSKNKRLKYADFSENMINKMDSITFYGNISISRHSRNHLYPIIYIIFFSQPMIEIEPGPFRLNGSVCKYI